jgi:hypothetical protein
MSIQGRVQAAVKGAVLKAALGMVVFSIFLTALGFLIAGFYNWIQHLWPQYNPAAITGGILVAAALIIFGLGSAILRKMKKPQPSILTEFTGMAGMAGRIAALLIRKDPRKSVVLAVLAGAVAEYLTSGDKKR